MPNEYIASTSPQSPAYLYQAKCEAASTDFEKLGEVKYFGEVSKDELYSLAADCDALIINKIAS